MYGKGNKEQIRQIENCMKTQPTLINNLIRHKWSENLNKEKRLSEWIQKTQIYTASMKSTLKSQIG